MEEKKEKIKKAEEIINEMSMSPEEWEIYDSRRKAIMNYNTDMITSREEGIKEGKREGIREGQKKKQEEIAKKMLDSNIPIENISKFTGLTKDEIEELK